MLLASRPSVSRAPLGSAVDEAYELLGLPRGTSEKQLRRAYLRLSILHHPDKQSRPASADETAFRRIKDAYDTLLKDPIAQRDRLNAEQNAERREAQNAQHEAELTQLQVELDMLDVERDRRTKQREKEDEERRARKEKQLSAFAAQTGHQHERSRRLAALQRHGSDRPPAVLFDDVYYRYQEEGNVWVANDGTMICRERVCVKGQPLPSDSYGLPWVLHGERRTNGSASTAPGKYYLFGSPHPYNWASQVRVAWATWNFLSDVPRARPIACGRIRCRAVGHKELKTLSEKEEEGRRQEALEQQRKDAEARQKEAEARQKEEEERAEKRRADRIRWGKSMASHFRQPLPQLTFTIGVGSQMASEHVRQMQEEQEARLTQRLRTVWREGRDDEGLRTELARVRCARHFQVECEESLWDRLQCAHADFTSLYHCLGEELRVEAASAIRRAEQARRERVAEERELLMRAQPGSASVREAANRWANRPTSAALSDPTVGQRIIVSRITTVLGDTLNGSVGTLRAPSRKAAAADVEGAPVWSVELDSGRVWELALSNLFALPDTSAAPVEMVQFGTALAPERQGKRRRADAASDARATGAASSFAVDAASEEADGEEEGGDRHVPKRRIRRRTASAAIGHERAVDAPYGSDSDGFGSSLASSDDDEEALRYAKRARRGPRRARHHARQARLARREMAAEGGDDEDEEECEDEEDEEECEDGSSGDDSGGSWGERGRKDAGSTSHMDAHAATLFEDVGEDGGQRQAADESARQERPNEGSQAVKGSQGVRMPVKRCRREVDRELPPGWVAVHHAGQARAYTTYRGPGGERAASRVQAWRTHHSTSQAVKAEGEGVKEAGGQRAQEKEGIVEAGAQVEGGGMEGGEIVVANEAALEVNVGKEIGAKVEVAAEVAVEVKVEVKMEEPTDGSASWLGKRVRVNGKSGAGCVCFTGRAAFAEGTWLGIEMDEAVGKHDGAVDGVRYFECRLGHGLMVPFRSGKVVMAQEEALGAGAVEAGSGTGLGSCGDAAQAVGPTLLELGEALASAPRKRWSPSIGSLIIGTPLACGVPTLGDYALGIVNQVPSALNDNFVMRFMWRDPIDSAAVQVRDAILIDKSSMKANRFLAVAVDSLPAPFSPKDATMLGGKWDAGAFQAEGFDVYKPRW